MLAAALLVFAAGLALAPMTESDLFFRLAAGREILAHHAIPARNLFSFTAPDFPDLDASWLFEVGAAALFRAGGFPAVVIGKALCVAATAALAFRLGRRRGAGPVAAALAVAAALVVMQERLVERPHIFSFAGEIAVLLALEHLESSGDAAPLRPRWRAGAALLLGVALWANLHAGVFVAPVLLLLYALGAVADRRAGLAVPAAALALLSLAAMLATPLGPGLFRYLALHVTIPRLHPIDEFRAVSPESDGALLVYATAALVAAGLVWRAQRDDVGLRRILPVLGLALLAARAIRFGADFALCAAPLLAAAATPLGERLRVLLPSWLRARGPAAGAALLLIGLALGPRIAGARQGRPFADIDLDRSALPLDAIRFADENGVRDRMYNDFEIGSYLVFEGYPRHRVFIDPRLPAYPPDLHRLLGRTDVDRAEWDRAMERYGVHSALLAYAGLNRRVSWWDPARWALIYRQHDARVFVRRLPRWRALIAAREIPATFSFTLEEGTATLPLAEPPPASPVPACEWQRRLGDLLVELDEGKPARAVAAYRRALAAPAGCLAPDDERALRRWLGQGF
ncbi:MAG TPA: hypothetical protein VFH68_19830 [Polyangia bacterium]|jgi:hypothetical protein|nr:hypothetical protein [Polyangia bacterium]